MPNYAAIMYRPHKVKTKPGAAMCVCANTQLFLPDKAMLIVPVQFRSYFLNLYSEAAAPKNLACQVQKEKVAGKKDIIAH